MTGEEARSAAVAAELALADECVAEARYAFEGGFYRLVRSRSYYAVFHAATALFMSHDLSFRKHSAILAAIDTHLVKTGTLPQDISRRVRDLYQSRLKSDYGDVAPVSREAASRAVEDAVTAVAALKALLGSQKL